MRKFLLSLFVFVLSLTAVIASKDSNQKHYVSVKAEEDPCKMESVKFWKITDFPFLHFIQAKNLMLTPTVVSWPSGAIQVLPSMTCNSGAPNTISVEVLSPGITDLPGPGAGMACVIHLGKVTVFGSGPCDITPMFNCVQNIQMVYSTDIAGGFELYTADLPDDLPPGTYELTCACTDQGGPITTPMTHPGIRWIDPCPATNPFINHRLTVTGAAPNDDCDLATAPVLANMANPATNDCSVDGKVWYQYTVINGKTINISAIAGTLASPTIYTIREGSCVGTISTLTCVQPGTILYIEAGNEGTNPTFCPSFGDFTITISDLTGLPEDDCPGALAPNTFGGNNILNCGETAAFIGNNTACADPSVATCFGAMTTGIWYSFTTATSLTTFSITTTGGGQYELFSGSSCAALTSLGCAVINHTDDPLTTYYLLVGPTGTVTVTAAALPTNDACAGALPVTAINNIGLTNLCATSDLVTCAAESEATVWYSFVLGANDDVVTFTSSLPNSVVRVYTACGGTLVFDADGVDCNNTATIECRTAGTYFIQVGSSFVNAGNFALNITATSNGVLNDDCAAATVMSVVNDCTYQPFTTTTVNACPETFSLACNGGNNNSDPTVWLQFTPPVGVTSINIRNITPAAAYLSILTPCGAATTIPGGGCITGAGPTANINVTGGTTYFIAAAIAGTEGVINFDIRYNDPPANDLCAGALPVTAINNTGLTNLCATSDLVTCAAQSEATVWYSFVLGANDDIVTFTSSLPNSVVRVYTACGGALVFDNDGIDCNNTATLECRTAGTYFIQVGSSFVNTGNFALNITATSNGVLNDDCTAATNMAVVNNCTFQPFSTTSVNACPETFNLACNGGNNNADPTVWLQFTPPVGVTSINIRNITPAAAYLSILTPCGAATTIPGGGCITGAGPTANINVTAGTTYFIAAAVAGGEGVINFDIKYNDPPANDLCAGALPVTAINNTGLTNLCATQDLVTCAAESEATVWYSFVLGANDDIVTFTSSLPNSVVRVYTACGGALVFDTDGVDCNSTATIKCRTAGTYFIQVGSSFVNTGNFALNITATSNGVLNDDCTAATNMAVVNNCTYQPFSTTTVNACPETFSAPCNGGNNNADPTVWLQFTPPLGVTSINIRNITPAAAYLSILTPCGSATTIPGGGCITGAGPTANINVTAGTTYFIAAAIAGGEGVINFDIKYNDPPDNDLCANPFPVALGPNAGLTNLCAQQELLACTGTNNEASVWYSYTIPAGVESLTISTNLAGGVIQVLQNDCNTLLNGVTNGCTSTVTLNCPMAQDIRIFMSSTVANSGIFTLTLTQVNTTAVNDLCVNAQDIANNPICEFFPVPVTTTVGSCPEQFTVTPCGFNYSTESVVWYEFTPPAGTTSVEIQNISANTNLTVFTSCPNPGPGTIPTNGGCLSGAGTNGNPILVTAGVTYYIAVGVMGTEGNVSFNIRYNQLLANDDPCMGGFIPTPLITGVQLTNQNNTCATDDNTCGGAIVENTLWYTFTLGAGFDRITINVTGLTGTSIAVYDVANPCMQMPVNEECNGDGMVDFNCLPPGTYTILIGSSAANAGVFSITATQGTNAGPANDFCNNATPLPGQPYDLCVELGPFPASNVNACPESLPAGEIFGACNFNTEETSWYIFTAPGMAGEMPTMDFTFVGYTGAGTPFMNVFEFGPDCTALNAVENNCFQGLNTVFGNIGPLTPGQQYLIALSSLGDTGGDFDFTVKFNLGPANDDKCADLTSYDLGSGSSLTAQTNLCSGADYIIGDCPAADAQNSVWYTFTVDAGSYGVSIVITGNAANMAPLTGPIVGAVFPDGCGSNIVVGTDCFPVDKQVRLDCLEPGTYDLQISTSSANAGDFDITLAQLVDNRECIGNSYSPDLSDLCADAIVINMAGVICDDILINGCNLLACPEKFNSGPCNFGTDPTVWYEFTVDANTAAIDITGLTAGYYFAILTGSPCTDNPPTALGGAPCISAPNTNNITVTGGETYYLVIADPMGGRYSFNIKQNAYPVNDDPIPASPRPPYELAIGAGHTSTTCCAIGVNDDPALDFPNVACSGATHDGAVWYTYTTGAEVGIIVQVNPGGTNPISGGTTVEVLQGTAAGPSATLFDPNSFDCGALPASIKIGCYEPGEVIWIKVASSDNDCGLFDISIDLLKRCPMADLCEEALDVIIPNPTDPNCGTVTPVFVPGCLENACPEEIVGDCGFGMGPTVWFQVMVDAAAVQLQTTVTTSGTWQPVWAIYYGDCMMPTLLGGGGPGQPPVPCSNSDSNPNIHSVGVVQGVDTYWIAVTGTGVIDNPDFQLGVTTLAGCVACIGEPGCQPQAMWAITDRSSDRPLDDPKFCQGEEVTVCITFNYDASETAVDWFHGLIPDFGPGWDFTAFDPGSIVVSPAGAEWRAIDDPTCAPTIEEQMPVLCTYNDPLTGRLVLCNTVCQACPCNGPLLPGSKLPSGWFWSRPGGAGCENDCRPSENYGIGAVIVNINFCVDLKVREFVDQAECITNRSLRFNFQTTSDGVSGCWNDPTAECKLDYAQIGPAWEVDCKRPPKVIGNDFEICHDGTTDIDLVTENGSNLTITVLQIPNPDVTGAMDHIFNGGFGTISDYLTNTSSSTTVQLYEAFANDPSIECPSPRDTFRVTIYPELIVELPLLNICFEDQDGELMVPTITGGTGNYVMYNWSTGATTPTIIVTHGGPNTISVTVTDNKGCTGTQTVDVNKLIKLSFTLTPMDITSCANEVIFEATNLVGNGSPLSITWNVPPELYAVDGGTSLTVNLPFSLPGTYEICATLTDEFSCMTQRCAMLTISLPPTVELAFVPPACGAKIADLFVQNYVTQTGANPTFTLVDCGGSTVYSMNGGGPPYQTTDPNGIFDDVDLSLNNCFKLLIEEEGGCSFLTNQLIIPLTSGTTAQLSAPTSICLGQSTTISIVNAASFGSGTFVWSPNGSGTSFVATPTQTTQYSVTVTNNGCVSVANVLITVNPLPTPGISGATSYCAGESTQLTASGGTMYSWSGPGGFTAGTASTGQISTAGTYIVTVTNVNGCTATSSATISQESFITVQISPVTICDNSVDSLNAGAGFDSYQWFDASNTLVGSSQFLQVTNAGTYTVSVTDGSCLGGGAGIVVNNITPTLNLPASLTVCRLNTGIGPTTINFVAIADTLNGQWFNTDNAAVDVTNWGNVDFTTVPSADTFNFVYIANTALAPCINPTDTVQVIVRNCACPNPAIRPIGPLCNSSTTPYNLNNTFISQTPPLPGDWTVVAPSPTPFPTITGNNIVVTGATPGTYTVRFTYNPPSPGNCPKFIENTLVVSPAPAISSRNTSLCNADIGAGPVMANLDTLLIGLIEPTPGSWTQISGATPAGTLPNIDVTGMARDTLRFQYTTTAVAPCLPRTTIVEVIIRNCECPAVTLVNDELCNGSMTLLDLQDPSRFTILPSTVTGTWTAQAPLIISNSKFINPFGVTPSPTPYTVTFTLNGTFPSDCQTVFTKTVRIRNQPVAVKLKDGDACSASTGNGATDLRLTSLLVPGFTTGGVWTQISPATPQLTIPATSIVEFNGQVPGTQFVFRYTAPITLPSPCTPAFADVTVTVKDCNCPDGNIDCINGDCDLCNSGDILDLTTTIVTPATFAPGVWTVVTGPSQNNVPLINGTMLDATGLAAGKYTAIYTLIPAPTGGCPRTDRFDFNIANYATAVINPDTLVCNGQNGITSFDIEEMDISKSSAGQWFDANGVALGINTSIPIDGLSPGTILNFTYVVNNADPCADVTYPVTIRITDNCNCTPIKLLMIPAVCTNANTFDLTPFGDSAQPGTWSATDPALVITNGVLNLTLVNAGVYSLTYTVTNPEPGCPTTATTMISISNPNSAGTARGAEFCLGATDVVMLRARLDNEDDKGIWTVVSGGSTGFDAMKEEFNLTGRSVGTYVFKYSFTNQGACPNDEEEVTIKINPLPVADAGADKNINCTVQSALLGTDLSSSGPNILYEWKLLNNVVGTSKKYTALEGGTYVLTVRDTVTKCSSTDNVLVIQADDLPIFDIKVDTIACFGETAIITLSNIRGGKAPYQISFDGGKTYGSAVVASNLLAGTYKVQVKDANGCVNDQLPEIVLTSPPLFAVNLGQDFFLNITEDSLLSIIGQYNDKTFKSIIWTANGTEIVSARDKGSYNAKPEVDTKYTVTVVNGSGCIATDVVNITLRRVKPECVPNIFSPNQSEVNEYFSINCNEVAMVTKYSIYDRWGNLLFLGENLSPSNPSSFWDGTFKGQPVVPGVYAYYIEMLFKDGSTEKRGGDVTVIR